jgi:hypothetical protein
MTQYREMVKPLPRQNARNIWASQILHRRELVVPEFSSTLLPIAGKPRRPSSMTLPQPVYQPPPKALEPRPRPQLRTFSQQVLGIPEVKRG